MVADGKIDVRPTSFNFFLNAKTGKEIVASCADKLRSENRAARSKEKTDAYLQNTRERSEGHREIPAETQAELDELLGESITDETKKTQK